MAQPQSSNSVTSRNPSSIDGPPCHCLRPTVMLTAWTDTNPGRRFYKCYLHGFFDWADAEEPHGWQRHSLLEARDQIRRLRKDKADLYNEFAELHHQLTLRANREPSDKMLRQMFVMSWGGFITVTAILVYMLKN
ncbi:hypothetical protein Bca4012_070481 [Brassica carinata]|uniref:GRF-type domain-containing protein n=1 Tax=Brassica carinata TaxID=52824 RepID=A0A8X7QIJ9_BRACI|nr:hypothetical protein Bca52824_062749 [Brassica carinata]